MLPSPKPTKVIFDIDGVLADIRHLLPLLPDYETYYHKLGKAKPIPLGVELFGAVKRQHGFENMVFITGRNEVSRDLTQEWLRFHVCRIETYAIPLFMRKNKDYRKSYEVKREHFERLHAEGEFDGGVVAYDDDASVIAMYAEVSKALGIPHQFYQVVSAEARS